MYHPTKPTMTEITGMPQYESETIEQKIVRVTTNGEPITDGAEIIYTERKNGVIADYDIRTDKWDIAIEAMQSVSQQYKTKREQDIQKREDIGEPKKIVNVPEKQN